MNEKRTFPTTVTVRYDRALNKSLKLNPPPSHLPLPQPTSCCPQENIALLERYREWLVGIGAADAVINQHRLPMAGHILGLALKPHCQLDLSKDFEKGMRFVETRASSRQWKRNCRHSLDWFRRFLKEERGMVVIDKHSFGDVERYKVLRNNNQAGTISSPNLAALRFKKRICRSWNCCSYLAAPNGRYSSPSLNI